ncbi:MAG: hypothetical protein Q9175_006755 [Cornicularia normoerica]
MKGSYEVPDRLAINVLDEYLPADLLCLLRALQRMPNVRKFGMSDRQWSEGKYWWHDCRDMLHSAILTINQTSFSWGKSEIGRQWDVIHSIGLIMLAGMPLFGSTLEFGIFSMGLVQNLGGGNVASVLNAAKGSEHLDLGFDVAYTQIPELAKLLEPLTWPSLRVLGLRNMVLEEDELAAFLTRHISTLESTTLENMILLNHHPQDPESAGWTSKSLKSAFRSMGVLALIDLWIFAPLNDGGPHLYI